MLSCWRSFKRSSLHKGKCPWIFAWLLMVSKIWLLFYLLIFIVLSHQSLPTCSSNCLYKTCGACFFLLSNCLHIKIFPISVHEKSWSLSIQILLEFSHLNEHFLMVRVEEVLLGYFNPVCMTLIFYGTHWFHTYSHAILVLSW